jgi:hypothetical protein
MRREKSRGRGLAARRGGRGHMGGNYVREAQSCAASAPSLLLAFLCC